MKQSIHYLASPYSHDLAEVEDARYEDVNRVAACLLSRGEIVFSPISHSHELARTHNLPSDYRFWRRFNEAFLRVSSMLYVLTLDGWKESVGVTAEIQLAVELKLDIRHISTADFE